MIDHPVWVAIQQHLLKNLEGYIIFISALGVAFVTTWPAIMPKTAQDVWTWIREIFQTAIPAARRPIPPPAPPPPPPPPNPVP
jgi:hypothetical protein